MAYLGLAACVLTGVGAWLYVRLSRAEARAERARADDERRRAADALALAERERQRERIVAAAHAEAARSRDNLRTILESIPDVVVVSRFDGSVAFVNGRGQQMFDIAPGSPITTKSVFERVVPEDRTILQRRRAAFATGGDPGTAAVRVAAPRGVRECEINGVRIEFEGAPAIVTMVRDVTGRREIERRLAVADRTASLGALAAGIAHEINNPLSCVLTNLRFLTGEPEGEGGSARQTEARLAACEALESAERVRRIVRDLQALTQRGEAARPVNLERVLDLAIHSAEGEIRGRARLVKDYAPIPPVRGDEFRLGQLALNLLVNAAQSIASGKPDENEIRVLTRPDDAGRVLVEVRDTGGGMPREVCERIFEPFLTTGPAGAGIGLGLAICQGIVSSLGGEIAVESEPGKGSAFRVALPAFRGGPPAPEPVASATG